VGGGDVMLWYRIHPPASGSASMAKKIAGWLILVLVIFYVVSNPVAAATTVKNIGAGLGNIAAGIGDFFARVISG
jgi:hypothetical protein